MCGVVNALSIFSDYRGSWKSFRRYRRSISVSQRLPGLQRVLNSFLRLFLSAERLERLPLQVEQVLFADGSPGSDIATANNFGNLVAKLLFVVADELALTHEVHTHFEGGQNVFPGGWNIRAHYRRLIGGVHEFKSAGFRFEKNTIAIHRDAVGAGQESEAASFMRCRRYFGGGDGFENLLHRFHHFNRFAASIPTDGGGAINGAQQHLLAPATAREQTDTDFDQSDVEFGMRLAGGGMKGDFTAAPEGKPKGRNHHRLGRKLDGLAHPLKLADGEIDVIPFFFLDRQQQEHQFGAHGEILRVVGDDEGVEVVSWAARLQGLRDQRDDVGADGIHLRVKLDASDTSTEIDERSSGILLDDAV